MKKAAVFKKEVLSAFQKVTPSKIGIENEIEFNKYLTGHTNLFLHKLHFPPELFSKKKILDFGCGTGEVDVIMAKWGARVTGFDFNEISIGRANALRKRFGLSRQLLFEKGDVDSFPIESQSYDRVVSYGVIAHVPHQEKMFARMAGACKNGGFVILGWVEEAGLIQRLLHRAICLVNADESEEKIYKIAWQCFREHIERSVRIGGRSAESVINDYLVNPHYVGISFDQIIAWAQKKKLEYYSSWPDVRPPFCVDSPYFPPLSLNSDAFKKYLSFLKVRWLFSQEEDKSVFDELASMLPSIEKSVENLLESLGEMLQKKKYSFPKLEAFESSIETVEKDICTSWKETGKLIKTNLQDVNKELKKIVRMIIQKASNDKPFGFSKIKKLFKGFNGLGTSYVVFYKPNRG